MYDVRNACKSFKQISLFLLLKTNESLLASNKFKPVSFQRFSVMFHLHSPLTTREKSFSSTIFKDFIQLFVFRHNTFLKKKLCFTTKRKF